MDATMSQRRWTVATIGRWLLLPAAFIVGVGAWLVLDPGFRSAGNAPPAVHMSQPEFEQRVRAYILDNPDVIMEAVQRLQARQRAADVSEGQAALRIHEKEVLYDTANPVGGNPAGNVTVVEFFDYNCPYCRRVAPVVAEVEAADKQLRVVYKEFPILGPKSMFAARAALAAHRQGGYVAFHQGLMRAKGVVDEAVVWDSAAAAGLDVERLRADMEDAEIQRALDRNIALAQALRITGTPGFVVGDQIVRGAIDQKALEALIQKARARQ